MQNIAGCCQQTFENKKFVDNSQQCFAFRSQANFPIHNLNFTEGDGMEFRISFKISFTLKRGSTTPNLKKKIRNYSYLHDI